jgi:hypothetical protein
MEDVVTFGDDFPISSGARALAEKDYNNFNLYFEVFLSTVLNPFCLSVSIMPRGIRFLQI